jgi:hypothetical protein
MAERFSPYTFSRRMLRVRAIHQGGSGLDEYSPYEEERYSESQKVRIEVHTE